MKTALRKKRLPKQYPWGTIATNSTIGKVLVETIEVIHLLQSDHVEWGYLLYRTWKVSRGHRHRFATICEEDGLHAYILVNYLITNRFQCAAKVDITKMVDTSVLTI